MIAFPPDRAELDVTERDDEPLRAQGRGRRAAADLADRRRSRSAPTRAPRARVAAAADVGFVKLSVIDAKGRVDRVTVRLK